MLRRVGERDPDGWVELVAPDPEQDPIGHLAVVRSHPDWTARALHDALAADGRPGWGELEDLLVADNEPGLVTLVAPTRSVQCRGAARGPRHRARPLVAVCRHLDHGSPGELAAVRTDRAGVQDEGSQLVAMALAAAAVRGPRSPGGSTCAPDPAARPRCSGRWPQRGASR